jgi:hypothetical protein
MQHYDDHRDDEVTELGVVSEDTKGGIVGLFDTDAREVGGAGIADD